jgi:hypothetical protein
MGWISQERDPSEDGIVFMTLDPKDVGVVFIFAADKSR